MCEQRMGECVPVSMREKGRKRIGKNVEKGKNERKNRERGAKGVKKRFEGERENQVNKFARVYDNIPMHKTVRQSNSCSLSLTYTCTNTYT